MAFNPAASIIDFLSSRGIPFQSKEQSFQFRKRLFEQAGLKPEEEGFRGREGENLALMRFLQDRERETGVSVNPDNLQNIMRLNVPKQESAASPTGTLEAKQITEEPSTDVTPLVDKISAARQPLDEAEVARRALEFVKTRTTFPLQQEAQESEKAEIQLQAQKKKEQLISTLASRGLFFSGQKEKGIQAINAEEIAKTFGVDRKFALLMAQGLETAAQRIATEAVKGEEAERKEAQDTLKALGFVVVGNKVVPTLQTQRAGLAEERAAGAEARAERGLELREEAAERTIEAAQRTEERQLLTEEERRRDNARQILNNEALYNVLSSVDKQMLWKSAGLTGNAPEKLTGKVEREKFLNADWFQKTFSVEQLYTSAIEAGKSKGFRKSKQDIVNEYMVDVMKNVDAYRQAGFSDADILKLMK